MLFKWLKGEFTKIEIVTETVRRFWVQIPELETIDFAPGQFMTFDLPIAPKRNLRLRSYSIASAPDGSNILEFVIVHLNGGKGSSYLFNDIKVGDAVKLRGPAGTFILPKIEDTDTEICFICTGTGLAPFRSMLLDIKNHSKAHPPIKLIFGTRRMKDVLYYDEMKQLATEMSNLDYFVALSREEVPEAIGSKGYVHPIYEKLYADKRPTTFYICGWEDMVKEAQERLLAMGYDRKQIKFELYG